MKEDNRTMRGVCFLASKEDEYSVTNRYGSDRYCSRYNFISFRFIKRHGK